MINKTKPHRGVFVDDSIGEIRWGNIHVTTIRVIHHTILWGKTYLSRVLYTERCLLFIQITCTDDAYSDRLVQFTF